MVNYQQGKIYKLVSPHTDKCFIGGTCMPLKYRISKHRSEYVKLGKTECAELFSKGSIYDVKIVLIEDYPCLCRDDLTARVAVIVRETPNAINEISNVIDKHKEIMHRYMNKSVTCDGCGIIMTRKNYYYHKLILCENSKVISAQ